MAYTYLSEDCGHKESVCVCVHSTKCYVCWQHVLLPCSRASHTVSSPIPPSSQVVTHPSRAATLHRGVMEASLLPGVIPPLGAMGPHSPGDTLLRGSPRWVGAMGVSQGTEDSRDTGANRALATRPCQRWLWVQKFYC